jgi:FKBP-type peptidyl-prolyl cis-trans isomerase 2
LNKAILINIIFLFIYSCKEKSNSFIKTNNGYVLNFHKISGDTNQVNKGCIVNLNILARDNNKKIVFSSKENGLDGVSSFYYDSTILKSPMNDILLKTFAGDSLSFSMKSFVFYKSLFGEKILSNIVLDSNFLNVYIKVLGFYNFKEQIHYQKKLEISAHNKEDSILYFAKKSWDSKFLNIYKSRGLYAIKLSSNDSLNFHEDSIKNDIIIDYTMKEISGRLIYKTSYLKPEMYDRSKEGQLLKGFEILVNNFQNGDSIVALIPSNLLFGRKGSFINKIPPFTPMKVNLKIN